MKAHLSYPAWFPTYLVVLLVLMLPATLTGCGSSMPDCTVTSLSVSPATATADHLAAPPGNKVQFFGVNNSATLPSGCAIAQVVVVRSDLNWASSDHVNVTIGNTQGVDYGLATCNNATSGAVTITATGLNAKNVTISGTATLTCK